jgi:hypothetical protein
MRKDKSKERVGSGAYSILIFSMATCKDNRGGKKLLRGRKNDFRIKFR